MSSASFAAATTASSSPLRDASQRDASQYKAPILKLLPYAQSGLHFAYSTIKSAALRVWQLVLPMPLIMYIISPLTVFLHYLGFIFVFGPYSTALFLVEALHPLYVFCGVACLTGVLLGVMGRTIAGFVVNSLLPVPSVVEEEDVKKEENEEESSSDNGAYLSFVGGVFVG